MMASRGHECAAWRDGASAMTAFVSREEELVY
jgi:hypothetical protein